MELTTRTEREAGTYGVTEASQAGWRLDSVACTINGSPAGDPTALVIVPMDSAECIFTNEKTVSLKITKISGAFQGTFDFTVTGPDASTPQITTQDDGQGHFMEMTTLTELEAGTYGVTEASQSGWRLDSVACTIN